MYRPMAPPGHASYKFGGTPAPAAAPALTPVADPPPWALYTAAGDAYPVVSVDDAGNFYVYGNLLSPSGETGLAPSGDTSGATDAASMIGLLNLTGTVQLTTGVFYAETGVIDKAPPLTISGAGISFTTIYAIGAGDCLRINTTGEFAGFGQASLTGFTIDGTHASAGACGLHMGDTFQPHLDIAINNFQGTGSKGAWFDNQYNACEQMTGRLYVRADTSHVVFDNSANPSGTATNSFDRTVLDIFIDSDGVGDGIVFQNGAGVFAGGRLGYYGNFEYGAAQYSAVRLSAAPSYAFTATDASPCVFTAAGSYYSDGVAVTLSGASLPAGFTATTYYVVNASGDTFQLSATQGGAAIDSTSTGSGNVIVFQQSSVLDSLLTWDVELDDGGPGDIAPYTIYFGATQETMIAGCTGVIDFGAGETFASTEGTPGYLRSFEFDGPVYGDALLTRSMQVGQIVFDDGTVSNGATLTTKYTGLVRVASAANVTGICLQGFDPDDGRMVTIFNRGAFTLTFAAAATSKVADGTADIIASLTAATFVWSSDDGLWYRTY